MSSQQLLNPRKLVRVLIRVNATLAVIVVVLGICIVTVQYALANTGSNVGRAVMNGLRQWGQDDSKNTQLDLQTSVASAEAKDNAQQYRAAPGEQINLMNGLSMVVTKVDRQWQPGTHHISPDPGNELIHIELLIGNRNQTKPARLEASDAILVADRTPYDPISTDSATSPRSANYEVFEPNEQTAISIVYEAPAGITLDHLLIVPERRNYGKIPENAAQYYIEL
ncbi:hypothetical protein CR970_02055 [Candidatus Saccharibacteria bacterium]|nr:MAG: hypothetical protein CR970_02055 [Candidatus Saccharibacteria bacterium]